MTDCATCQLFHLEAGGDTCLHVNRPGGLTLTKIGLDLSGLPMGANILDVASGASTTLDYLGEQLGMKAVGLDLSSEMLCLGKQRYPNHHLIQADCGQIPLPDDSQQAVLMECALSLAGNIRSALREYQRILTQDGMLIVTDVYVRDVVDPTGINCLAATHCLSGAMTEDEVRREVAAAGFQIRFWQDETLLLKQWLTGMIFKLGSLEAFYRQLVSCDSDAEVLCGAIGVKIKLGYYLMIAEKQLL